MDPWIATGVVLVPLVGAAAYVRTHRRGRDRMYARLEAARAGVVHQAPIEVDVGGTARDPACLASAFAAERLLRVDEFVSPATLTCLRDEALRGIPRMDPSSIPLHKKGHTLSYEQVLRLAPHAVSFYYSRSVQRWLSIVTGTNARPTPLQDQSSLSVLCYKDAGDHIGWHYDHNFYRGRHFTVLLALVNRSAGGGLSQGRLERQLPDGTAQAIDMPEGALVVFEGNRVRHRATPIVEGDLRVILSMTYCDDPRISRVKEVARRVKDTAFFGIRALWD